MFSFTPVAAGAALLLLLVCPSSAQQNPAFNESLANRPLSTPNPDPIGAIENRQIGQGEAKQGITENVGLLGILVGGAVGIGGLIFAMRNRETAQPQPQVVYVQSPAQQPHGVTTKQAP